MQHQRTLLSVVEKVVVPLSESFSTLTDTGQVRNTNPAYWVPHATSARPARPFETSRTKWRQGLPWTELPWTENDFQGKIIMVTEPPEQNHSGHGTCSAKMIFVG